jgi:hypothetical protein
VQTLQFHLLREQLVARLFQSLQQLHQVAEQRQTAQAQLLFLEQ